MPKELLHFHVAQKALRCMEPGPLKEAVEARPNLYLLGSVLPDTPLYALYRRARGGGLSSALHGAGGEDSFAPAKRVLLGDRPPGAGEWAFMLGALCHVMTDAVVHPWVMYRSGRGHLKGSEHRERFLDIHRSLETWMDVALLQRRPEFSPRLFGGLLAAREMGRARFLRAAGAYFGPGHQDAGFVAAAFAAHAALQGAFFSRPLEWILRRAGGYLGRPQASLLALFYPPAPGAAPVLAGPLDYRHPVTGRKRTTSLYALEQKAASVSARLFSRLQAHREAGTLSAYLSRVRGPSLETGLVGVPSASMAHLDPEPDVNRLLFSRKPA
ncbi:MAG: zinc dependent phospholipase C family protein [Deltaproteobacteria bacterium]|nr:zinc dependent phospholipase C family protein [Deltaproteobacteria bacterium]